jgi:hypothetical protein
MKWKEQSDGNALMNSTKENDLETSKVSEDFVIFIEVLTVLRAFQRNLEGFWKSFENS